MVGAIGGGKWPERWELTGGEIGGRRSGVASTRSETDKVPYIQTAIP